MRVDPKDILGLLAQLPGLIASGSFNINDQETSSTTQTYSINKILALIAASGAGDMLKSDNLSGLANNDTALANIGAGTGTGGGRAVFKANDAAAIRLLLALGTAALASLDNDGALTANSTTAVPTQQAIRSYVEGKVAGLAWKPAVRAATTTATPLANVVPGFVMDTVTLATGDDFLDKDNSDQSLRGIYTVQASGAPVRRGDANTIARLVNATVYVSEGAAVASGGNLDTQWTCTVNKSATLGTSPIIWVRTGAGGVLLGTDVGSVVQAYDADLASIAALATAANKLLYFTGPQTAALADLTAFARAILDDPDAATVRATIGLIIGQNVQAWDADLDLIAALATTTFGRNLLTLADAAAARSAIAAASLAANTFTGKQTLPASAAASAGLNLPQGSAPTSPQDGDVWTTSLGLYARIAGVTVGPFAAGGGAALREQTLTIADPDNNVYATQAYTARVAQTVTISANCGGPNIAYSKSTAAAPNNITAGGSGTLPSNGSVTGITLQAGASLFVYVTATGTRQWVHVQQTA